MTNQEKELQVLAKIISMSLGQIYGQRMGFFLCVTTFNDKDGISDFIGNASHESHIKWMEDTLENLKAGTTIPETVGNA